MDYFPIFLSLKQNRVVLSGGGEAAKAKLRLLLKTSANIEVFAKQPDPEIVKWARAKRLHLFETPLTAELIEGAALFYASNEDASKDRKVATLARSVGVLVNIVDNLQESQFITPAIVDRDPVTVAIGTEGTAPVLARAIKADIENRLPRHPLIDRGYPSIGCATCTSKVQPGEEHRAGRWRNHPKTECGLHLKNPVQSPVGERA